MIKTGLIFLRADEKDIRISPVVWCEANGYDSGDHKMAKVEVKTAAGTNQWSWGLWALGQ